MLRLPRPHPVLLHQTHEHKPLWLEHFGDLVFRQLHRYLSLQYKLWLLTMLRLFKQNQPQPIFYPLLISVIALSTNFWESLLSPAIMVLCIPCDEFEKVRS